MAFGQNPGALFIGTLFPDDKAFVASVLKAAKENGYTKVVEPCSGQLAMSCIAADLGYEDIEASDITIFSGVLGRYVEGRPIDDMGIKYVETGESPESAAEVMYEIKHRELLNAAGSVYGDAMLIDFESRKDAILKSIHAEMDALKERIPNLTYRDMDMFDHINAVKDVPGTVILCMCPTYKGGYEKFYKAISDSVEWNEPPYSVFEPPAGYQKLLDAVEGSEALLIIYEEVPVGEHVGTPVYGRQGGRVGINMYLVSNRPEEVERLLGTSCSRKKPAKIAPMKYPLMPQDYVITKKSRVEVVKAGTENIRYYRKLFTHNFTPSQASSGYAMIVDGYLAGIFGYMTMANTLGGNADDVFIGFGMCTKTNYRLNRLLYMVACQRRSVRLEFDDLKMATLKCVKTAMITKYPESKEMRGLMKLQSKVHDERMGWKLTYGCDIQDKTYRQVMAEFLQKEEQWQKKRQA